MNDNENLPTEAEIIVIRATAEESKKPHESLLAKTTIIKKAITPSEFQLPQGPTRVGGTWYV